MASKEVTLAELGALLTHVVDHMATKEDIAELKDDIADIGIAMATKNDLAQILPSPISMLFATTSTIYAMQY